MPGRKMVPLQVFLNFFNYAGRLVFIIKIIAAFLYTLVPGRGWSPPPLEQPGFGLLFPSHIPCPLVIPKPIDPAPLKILKILRKR